MKISSFTSYQFSFVCLITFCIVLLSACTPNQPYHTRYDSCDTATPKTDCTTNTIVNIKNPADPDADYSLAFIEFDDQGQLYDRKQLAYLTDDFSARATHDNLLIVTFVHGWQHNAQPDDIYLIKFHKILARLSKLEAQAARKNKRKKRQIAGVYLGWRGRSLDIPLLNTTTFWERKNTAHKIGRGGVAEVFSKLEEIRNIRNSIDKSEVENNSTASIDKTRLVILGHSFGGAIVYTALSQIFMERFVQTKGPVGVSSDAIGFGDLVVLLNPAFEATRFLNLSLMANERGTYFDSQLPILAAMTSEADWATKYAFWFGRVVSTLFDNYRSISYINQVTKEEKTIHEGVADRSAIGHFTPIQTHYLRAKPKHQNELGMVVFQRVQKGWATDQPGEDIEFKHSILHRNKESVPHNPYLIIQVDKKIIPNHSDVLNDAVEDFLVNFILLSMQ